MKTDKRLIIGAEFSSPADAERYLLPYWEVEPGPEISDEEYLAWEKRNPRWAFAEETRLKLDSTFAEISHDLDDLTTQILESADIDMLRQKYEDKKHFSFLLLASDCFSGDIQPVVDVSACSRPIEVVGVFNFDC